MMLKTWLNIELGWRQEPQAESVTISRYGEAISAEECYEHLEAVQYFTGGNQPEMSRFKNTLKSLKDTV